MESWIKELSSSADLKPDSNGSDIQKMLAGIANRAQEKKFSYNKFFAIGLFRMLELTGGQPDGAQAHSVPSCDLALLHRGGLQVVSLTQAGSRAGGCRTLLQDEVHCLHCAASLLLGGQQQS